jgi:hypothetical protein
MATPSELARLPELTGAELDVLGSALVHYLMALDGPVHPSCGACQAARRVGVPACASHNADGARLAEQVAIASSLATAVAEARYHLR